METLLITILILNIFQSCVEAKINNEGENYVPNFRIFKGESAKAAQFPYQVALKTELQEFHALQYGTFCGGSLISSNKVISAAHCFTKIKSFWEFLLRVPAWRKLNPLKTLYVVAGTLTNEQVTPIKNSTYEDVYEIKTEQWRRVRKVRVPDKQFLIKLDVAVVTVKNEFKLNNDVAVIPFASENKDYTGLKCLASGYGLVSKEVNVSKALNLQFAELKVVPTQQCSDDYGANMKKFVCTESTERDVRPGDSGGPLVCFKTGDPKEVGEKGLLVGIACAITPGKPSMFTRVSDYIKFIDN